MPGIPREVAEHELRILPGSKPVQQRLCRFDDERRRAIGEEIAKLLAAGFTKEVYHSDWLSNPVLVKKKTCQWRMCVDLHQPEQGFLQRPFSLAKDRSDNRLHLWVRNLILSRCLIGLSPNSNEGIRLARDILHHAVRLVLLRINAVRS